MSYQHLISLFIFLVYCLIEIKTSELPKFECQINESGGCIFQNVILTEAQPHWQPVANISDYNLITSVHFGSSQFPILTNDICRTFRSITGFFLYTSQVKQIHENAFWNCTKLEVIALVDNPLKEIPKNLFVYSTRLSTLHIYNNNLREFPTGVFDNMTQLRYLDASGNNLTNFPAELVKNSRIFQNLLIYSNDLSHLDIENMIQYSPSLNYVSFNDNEISCVRTVEIIKMLNGKNIYVANNTAITKPKVRYYPQQRVLNNYICNPDISWSGAHYRKENEIYGTKGKCEENNEMKIIELEKRLESIEGKLGEVLRELKSLSSTGIPA